MAGGRERERRPVEPPPVVQVRVKAEASYLAQHYLESPHYFMCCSLANPSDGTLPPSTNLTGTLVSSLHELKDQDNNKMGLFVFGDLSVEVEGDFRLKFTLFEMGKGAATHLQSIISDRFTVFRRKSFPGMAESTPLSRSLVDQGVKLRLRKKPRSLIKRSVPPRLEHCTQPAPPYSQDRASLHMPGDIFRSHTAPGVAGSRHYSYCTDPVKRQCLSLDSINPVTHNDGQMYEIEAHPQTAALHDNQPQAYPTQGSATRHASVPNYQMSTDIPPLARIPHNL